MTAAKLSLISFLQDGKMLSCKRWLILFASCCLNLNFIIICLLPIGLFGSYISICELNKINAAETVIETSNEETFQNELANWIEAKNAKYSGYKISYPEKGIVYANEFFPLGNTSVRVNILEINKKINPNLEIKPVTASKNLNSKVKIHDMAVKNNSIAAINGGYFKPQTGIPLGALMIDNELLTGPVYNRAAIGINANGKYTAGKTDIKFFLKNKKISLKIDNFNQPRMLSTYSLIYTSKWGKNAPLPPKYGVNAVISKGRIKGVYKTSVEIPSDGFVLSAPYKTVEKLSGQKDLKLETEYPEAFKDSIHIISGGPYLVKDGAIYIDVKEEKLTAVNGRNPRTLIGYTKNNDLIIAVIDGRESKSIGMSLYEAAKFMHKLGCVNAINLDGGSSSVMYLKGQIANKPQTAGGIPIPGALTVGIRPSIAELK